jgi:hypothetical protein
MKLHISSIVILTLINLLINIEAFHDIPSQSSDNLHCKYPRIDPKLINISAWSQRRHSQPVQAIERIVRDHLHALPHISHGYFIGPGFGWQSDAFDVSRAKIYNRCDVEPFPTT